MDELNNKLLAQVKQQLVHLVQGIEDLQVGDIIYYNLDCADGITPHTGYTTRLKYIVVAGDKSNNKEVCVAIINSKNSHSSNKDWLAEQYLIRQTDYPDILDYDSWIDCTDLKELKVAKIKAKKAEKKGHLNPRDLANVMRHLQQNGFISTHILKVYGIDKFQP